MSFPKAICLLTCGAALILGCQERASGGEPSKPVEGTLEPVAATRVAAPELKARGSVGAVEAQNPRPLPPDESRYPQSPDRPRPALQLEPMDMMTAVGDSPLHVLVSKLDAADASRVLERVASAVKLRTWPELDEVPTTASRSVETSASTTQAGYGHVYLQPAAPLTDRWYALVIESLPAGVELPTFANIHKTDSGQHISRFRVGSQPVVTGVRLYEKEGQKQVAYVDFSERVVGDALGVVVTGPAGKCQGAPPPAAAKRSGLPSKGDGASEEVPADGETSTASIQLACSGRLDVRDDLNVEIKSGFRSASGPQLNAGKALRVKATAAGWSDWGRAGKQLRLATP